MSIPLEDLYQDILGKAQRGLGLADAEVCAAAGIAIEAWQRALAGTFEESTARAVAPVLGLGCEALVASGRGTWHPPALEVDGLRGFNSVFGDMRVNAYVVWHPHSLDAVIFDTGTDAGGILATVQAHGLKVRHILLTHAHPDHVADLPALRKALPDVPVSIHRNETAAGADTFGAGTQWNFSSLSMEARLTAGHSPGGTTFVIHGLKKGVAIVGDALFAGSMGGAPQAWKSALQVNREQIFSLDPTTVLCPGHGPMTTVAWERQHNPFYAD